MSTPARLQQLIEPVVTGLGLDLYDLQYTGSVLSVLVERRAGRSAGEGGAGVGLDDLAAASRAVSRVLDEADPIPGRYTLEMSSPGLERPLRTPAHFAGALGEVVSVKTAATHDGPRRLRGRLVRAGGADDPDPSVDVQVEPGGEAGPDGETVTVPLAAIERARTVFEWGPGPKPKAAGRSRPAARPDPGSRDPAATTPADDKKVSAT